MTTGTSRRSSKARYLDGSHLSANPDWYEEDAAWKAAQVGRLFERHRLEPTSVCDFGCGTGGVLDTLRTRLPPTTRLAGYEISDGALRLAPSERFERVELLRADPRRGNDRFDVILLLDVFEHVDDYLGFLRSFHGHADLYVLHIPLDVSVQAVLRASPFLTARRVLGHLHYFTRETALATLADAGFKVVDEQITKPRVDLPARSAKARIARFPRRLLAAISPRLAARLLGGFELLVLARGKGEHE